MKLKIIGINKIKLMPIGIIALFNIMSFNVELLACFIVSQNLCFVILKLYIKIYFCP